MLTRIVAKKKDGTLMKGMTGDFLPFRNFFHILDEKQQDKVVQVAVDDLKAVFFVRRLEGNRKAHHTAKRTIGQEKDSPGKKIKVIFLDGEAVEGYTYGFDFEQLGFFLIPLDSHENNERIFVVRSSVKEIISEDKSGGLSGDLTEIPCQSCGKGMEPVWQYCPFDGSKLQGVRPLSHQE